MSQVVLVNTDLLDLSDKYPIATLKKIPAQVPLGILYLAAVLEENHISVSIIDNYVKTFSDDILTQKILDENPRVVGFSTTTQNVPQAFAVSRRIKELAPQVKIVFGGPHATVLPEDVLSRSYVDYVIVSEGEYALLELVQAIQDEKSIEDIKGLFHKDVNARIVYNGVRPAIAELDRLPFPARHLIDFNDYAEQSPMLEIDKIIPVSSSRGCPYRCAFCTSSEHWQRRYRYRSAKNVVDEIEYVIKEYGAEAIKFREDNFTVNKKRMFEVFDELERRQLNIRWECESRVDALTLDVVKRMKSTGCYAMWFGIESGNQHTLDFLQKDIKLDQVYHAFNWCRQADIRTGATFMVGIPGETRADVLNTLEFVKSLDPDYASFQAYLGLPQSKLYQYIISNHLYLERIDHIYIVQTHEMNFREIVKIEQYVQNMYRKFRLIKRVKNPMFRLFLRILPLSALDRLLLKYHSSGKSFRVGIKKILHG